MIGRIAVVGAVGLVSVVLGGCADGGRAENSEAFTGPLSNDLIVSASTDCQDGRIEPGDTVRISGFDYLPDSAVTLRWTVPNDNSTGTWDPVTADQDGDFTTSLKVGRSMVRVGDTVVINSEGTGQTGLMVLRAVLEVGTC